MEFLFVFNNFLVSTAFRNRLPFKNEFRRQKYPQIMSRWKTVTGGTGFFESDSSTHTSFVDCFVNLELELVYHF